MPSFPLAPHFTTFLLRHAQKSTFWDKNVTYVFTLSLFWASFLFLLFLPFLIFYWNCFQLKKFWENVIEMGKLYHGVATCCHRQLRSEFFTQISEHFCAYFRLHCANYSDLGINGKIFPPAELEYKWCQFWSKVMSEKKQRPMLFTAGYGWHKNQWVQTNPIPLCQFKMLNVSCLIATSLKILFTNTQFPVALGTSWLQFWTLHLNCKNWTGPLGKERLLTDTWEEQIATI